MFNGHIKEVFQNIQYTHIFIGDLTDDFFQF
jgi:hypothetical protein